MFTSPDYGLRSAEAIRLFHVSAEPLTTRIRAIPSTRRHLWTLGGQRFVDRRLRLPTGPICARSPGVQRTATRPTRRSKIGAGLTNVCQRAPLRGGIGPACVGVTNRALVHSTPAPGAYKNPCERMKACAAALSQANGEARKRSQQKPREPQLPNRTQYAT
jgi:hypothetical protein